jgi:hypothetical protein
VLLAGKKKGKKKSHHLQGEERENQGKKKGLEGLSSRTDLVPPLFLPFTSLLFHLSFFFLFQTCI